MRLEVWKGLIWKYVFLFVYILTVHRASGRSPFSLPCTLVKQSFGYVIFVHDPVVCEKRTHLKWTRPYKPDKYLYPQHSSFLHARHFIMCLFYFRFQWGFPHCHNERVSWLTERLDELLCFEIFCICFNDTKIIVYLKHGVD